AEEFSLDLAVLENITEVPSTVDDLHRFLNDLPKGNQRETA
ncbi:MAG: hypothetical protein JWP36_480, partial [Paucimonas sp.]|nr:hypothetical protein [Paucimonas sp.]